MADAQDPPTPPPSLAPREAALLEDAGGLLRRRCRRVCPFFVPRRSGGIETTSICDPPRQRPGVRCGGLLPSAPAPLTRAPPMTSPRSERIRPIAGAPKGRVWLGKSWEDPFLWFDSRGSWHILAHAYTMETYLENGNKISGHGYSENGVDWSV